MQNNTSHIIQCAGVTFLKYAINYVLLSWNENRSLFIIMTMTKKGQLLNSTWEVSTWIVSHHSSSLGSPPPYWNTKAIGSLCTAHKRSPTSVLTSPPHLPPGHVRRSIHTVKMTISTNLPELGTHIKLFRWFRWVDT